MKSGKHARPLNIMIDECISFRVASALRELLTDRDNPEYGLALRVEHPRLPGGPGTGASDEDIITWMLGEGGHWLFVTADHLGTNPAAAELVRSSQFAVLLIRNHAPASKEPTLIPARILLYWEKVMVEVRKNSTVVLCQDVSSNKAPEVSGDSKAYHPKMAKPKKKQK